MARRSCEVPNYFYDEGLLRCVPCSKDLCHATVAACRAFCQAVLTAVNTTVNTTVGTAGPSSGHTWWPLGVVLGVVIVLVAGIGLLWKYVHHKKAPRDHWPLESGLLMEGYGQQPSNGQQLVEQVPLTTSAFDDSISGSFPQMATEAPSNTSITGQECRMVMERQTSSAFSAVNSSYQATTDTSFGAPDVSLCTEARNDIPTLGSATIDRTVSHLEPPSPVIPGRASDMDMTRWPPIPQHVYDILNELLWVLFLVTSGGNLEVYVDEVKPLDQAKCIITDKISNTLSSRQLKVYHFRGSSMRNLHGILPTGESSLGAAEEIFFLSRKSIMGCFLYCPATDTILMVTTAHDSGVGTEYFQVTDQNKQNSIGICVAAFRQNPHDCDIAFVKINDHYKKKVCNMLTMRKGTDRWVLIPKLSNKAPKDLAEAGTPIFRHANIDSRPVGCGRVAKVHRREDGQMREYTAIIPDENESGFCLSGDSGSLITSRSTTNSSAFAEAYGVLVGSCVCSYYDGGQEKTREMGIFSPLSKGIPLLNQQNGTHHNYTLQMLHTQHHDLKVTAKSKIGDSGYQSGYQSLSGLHDSVLLPSGSTHWRPPPDST